MVPKVKVRPYNPEYIQNYGDGVLEIDAVGEMNRINMNNVTVEKVWLELKIEIDNALRNSSLSLPHTSCFYTTVIHKSLAKGLSKKIKTEYIYKRLYFTKRQKSKLLNLHLKW